MSIRNPLPTNDIGFIKIRRIRAKFVLSRTTEILLHWVQREGGPVEEVYPGDIVWFEPNEKHWHEATETNGMTHIAIQENVNGKVVDWMEKVSDEEYRKPTL